MTTHTLKIPKPLVKQQLNDHCMTTQNARTLKPLVKQQLNDHRMTTKTSQNNSILLSNNNLITTISIQ